MSNPSLHSKTIRPGSLNGYSYYYSGRRPTSPQKASKTHRPGLLRRHKVLLAIAVALAAASFGYAHQGGGNDPKQSANTGALATSQGKPEAAAPGAAALATVTNHCEGNAHSKLIKVSVSQRRLWACQGSQTAKDFPVITGLNGHAETETPPGNYHIYAKQTNTALKGADSRGSWNYSVSYWMPFLDNQYGTYGFHDATWRADSLFGNVSPDSPDASHGCIESNLANSKWLYDWAPMHTPVTIES